MANLINKLEIQLKEKRMASLSATSESSSQQLTKHGSPKENQPTASPSAVGYAIQQQQQQQQSPRNTLNSSSSTIGYVHFGAIDVPKAMQEGEKFIKWDEVSQRFFFIFFILLYIYNKREKNKWGK